MPRYVGVVGPSSPDSELLLEQARQLGQELARRRLVVVTGGLGGVMEAASRGAREGGGIALGLLPGRDREAANPHLSLSLPTGLGELRGGLLVRSCDALVAIGGSWGTMAEIALACRTGVPVVALGGWELRDGEGSPVPGGPLPAASIGSALELLDEILGRLPGAPGAGPGW